MITIKLNENTNSGMLYAIAYYEDPDIYSEDFWGWDTESDVGYELMEFGSLIQDADVFDSLEAAEDRADDVLSSIFENEVFIVGLDPYTPHNLTGFVKKVTRVDDSTKKYLIKQAQKVSNDRISDAWISDEFVRSKDSTRILLNIPIAKEIDSAHANEAEAHARKTYDTNDVWWNDFVLQVDVTDWFEGNDKGESLKESANSDITELGDGAYEYRSVWLPGIGDKKEVRIIFSGRDDDVLGTDEPIYDIEVMVEDYSLDEAKLAKSIGCRSNPYLTSFDYDSTIHWCEEIRNYFMHLDLDNLTNALIGLGLNKNAAIKMFGEDVRVNKEKSNNKYDSMSREDLIDYIDDVYYKLKGDSFREFKAYLKELSPQSIIESAKDFLVSLAKRIDPNSLLDTYTPIPNYYKAIPLRSYAKFLSSISDSEFDSQLSSMGYINKGSSHKYVSDYDPLQVVSAKTEIWKSSEDSFEIETKFVDGSIDDSDFKEGKYAKLSNTDLIKLARKVDEIKKKYKSNKSKSIKESNRIPISSIARDYVEVAYICDGFTNFRVFGGGFKTSDALVSVEDEKGKRLRLTMGDVCEFYTWYDAKGNVIHEPTYYSED